MAKERIEIGATGLRVAARISSRRKALDLTQAELSARLMAEERPMSQAVIGEIERGARRVDVDDLFAFANALEVSPEWLIALDENQREQLEAIEASQVELRISEEVESRLPAAMAAVQERFNATLAERVESLLSASLGRVLAEREAAPDGDD